MLHNSFYYVFLAPRLLNTAIYLTMISI